MGKIILFILGFTFLLLSLFSCEKEEPPKANFIATQAIVDGKLQITFNDISGNNPDKRQWIFEGGTPNTSNEKNPTVCYNDIGQYGVKLFVYNEGGSDEISKENYINTILFENPLITDVVVSYTFKEDTVVVPALSSCYIALIGDYYSSCHIETCGKDFNGKQTGLLIYWDINLNTIIHYGISLGVSDQLVFFIVNNISNADIQFFRVNVGDYDFETFEEAFIPNDGKKYRIGYYFAKRGMIVRAYSSDHYLNWIDPVDFTIPWIENQLVYITYTNVEKNVTDSFKDTKIKKNNYQTNQSDYLKLFSKKEKN